MASKIQLIPLGETRKAKSECPDCWVAPTGDAQFDIIVHGNVFPSGWVLLDSKLVHYGSNVIAKLIPDTGSGFLDTEGIVIPIRRNGIIHELIKLPHKTMGLRWQVIGVQTTFEQHLVSIKKVGIVERILRMYRRTAPMFFMYSRNKRRKTGLTFWRLFYDLFGAYKTAAILRMSPPDWTYRNWLYARWIRSFDTLTQQDMKAISQHIARLSAPPQISILMPVYNPPVHLLRETIDSVLGQLYPYFELCIADDASTDAEVRFTLEEYARRDARIKVAFRGTNGHISAASNTALTMATGPFVALLDHDDLLAPQALYLLCIEILRHPDVEIVYSDEDKINENGTRLNPYFKPDWNPQLVLSQNFVSHLGMYRTDTIRQIGGFREGFEGSQDYDLMLRVVARVKPSQIRHIPAVLYHWRVRPGSTALGPSEKDYAWDAGRRAIEGHLSSQGISASVSRSLSPVFYRVHYALPDPAPKVSVIIPTRNHCFLLRRCVESLLELSTYKNFEVIIVDNGSSDPDAIDYINELRGFPDFRVLSFPWAYNYSAMNNMAAAVAEGDVLCLLNNDTEVISANWMEEMLGCLMQQGVGVVGARLLYPDNTVQHAGVILAGKDRVAMHAHASISRNDRGYVGRATLAQDLSAVTGACMMVRRQVFMELDGLDEKNLAVAFNDVDFCLRAKQSGWRVVYTPYAELYHHESATRGGRMTKDSRARMLREIDFMQRKWEHILMHDPAYNPNLTKVPPDFSLSRLPKVIKPWDQ